jgi:hypothetical protein
MFVGAEQGIKLLVGGLSNATKEPHLLHGIT